MNRNNRHGKNKSWNNQRSYSNNFQNNKENFSKYYEGSRQTLSQENNENLKKNEQAIKELKSRTVICPLCQKAITDVSSALSYKTSGSPVHFECVMSMLEKSETVGHNEKICYIGQGRFGILYFENPRDQRHFTIKKIIEWENRDAKFEWRDEISSLYSQVL